jgi:hypothetical protein
MVDLPTVVTSVLASTVTGVVVAFLAPHFQHSVWKTQRLREQRIAVADRFAKTAFSTVTFSLSQSVESITGYLEQSALLALIQVLFNDTETLQTATAFKSAFDRMPTSSASSEDLKQLHALRIQLLALLFAEAFDISTDKLARRTASKSIARVS